MAKIFLETAAGDAESRDEFPMDSTASSADTVALAQVLTVTQMVGLIFFETCGGTYGVEPVVMYAGGPWLALAGLTMIQFVWSVPIALMTAEMCSAFPHIGGKVYFVQWAFGSYVGWLNGAFNTVGNIFDVATLPVMALGYAKQLGGFDLDSWEMWYFACSLVLAACVLNVMGVEVVGNASFAFACAVCCPFIILFVMGAPRLPQLASTEFIFRPTSTFKFLTCLMWNTAGYDDAGATAAEVLNPQDVYPQSLAASILLVTFIYIGPVSVGLSAQPDMSAWEDGEFANIGRTVGGDSMYFAIVLLGIVSCFGQVNALLCASVREIACMADLPGMPIPQFLAWLHPKYQTPYVCTILFTILLIPLMSFGFADLIAATVFFDCFSFLLQFSAWVQFRWTSVDVPSSSAGFRCMSLGRWGVLIVSAFPCGLCIWAVALTLLESSQGFVGVIGTTAVATVMYALKPVVDAMASKQGSWTAVASKQINGKVVGKSVDE